MRRATREPLVGRQEGGGAERRRYERPRIIVREPLEAFAAVCSPPGKADAGSCPSGPISS